MFEGNILNAGLDSVGRDNAHDAEGLRELGWGELVARLDAVRDYRRLMSGSSGQSGGSFDSDSARQLQAFGDGQRGINPFALTNRKTGQVNNGVGSETTMTGDRGR
jgi:hypothetical protein